MARGEAGSVDETVLRVPRPNSFKSMHIIYIYICVSYVYIYIIYIMYISYHIYIYTHIFDSTPSLHHNCNSSISILPNLHVIDSLFDPAPGHPLCFRPISGRLGALDPRCSQRKKRADAVEAVFAVLPMGRFRYCHDWGKLQCKM